MLEPKSPELRIDRCLSDSFNAWTHHLPVLFLASALALVVGLSLFPFFFVATLAGLTCATCDAVSGAPVRVRTVFRGFRHPIRFIFLNAVFLGAALVWALLLVVLFVFLLPESALPPGLHGPAAWARNALSNVLSDEITRWLPAYRQDPDWRTIGPALLFIGAIQLEFFLLGLRSLYVALIAARDDLPIVDAYVQSRNAVARYGYWRHLMIAALVVAFLALPGLVTGESLEIVAVLLVLPFALGIVASAYSQTIGVEEENRQLRERQFVEMRDELQTAHDMQMSLLPDGPPDLPGYYLDGLSVPANNVGGDYFAYRWLDDEHTRLAIVVADVSGKAMQAAVTALRFNEILRYECRDRTEPGPILDGLTRSLDGQIEDTTFVTCCIAVLDVRTGEVEIANAGHCYPYQVGRKSKLVLPVDLGGLPLGMSAAIRGDRTYESVTVTLQPGDGLVLYSDGVVEAMNASGDMFGEERLCEIIQHTLPEEGSTTAVRSIYRSVESFVGTAPRTDDITVVALKRGISPDEVGRPQNVL